MENYFFSKIVLLQREGAVSHNVFYYQQLPITQNQVRFYANNYFDELLIVSTVQRHCTPLVIVKDQCFHLVYPILSIK